MIASQNEVLAPDPQTGGQVFAILHHPGSFQGWVEGLVICVMGAIQVALKYLLLAELAHKRKAGGD